jgi:hypothetical protein
LEREQVVEAAAENLRLKAGFALQRDEARLERSGEAETLLDDAEAIVGDVPNAGEQEEQQEKRQTPDDEGELRQNHESLLRDVRGMDAAAVPRLMRVSESYA